MIDLEPEYILILDVMKFIHFHGVPDSHYLMICQEIMRTNKRESSSTSTGHGNSLSFRVIEDMIGGTHMYECTTILCATYVALF